MRLVLILVAIAACTKQEIPAVERAPVLDRLEILTGGARSDERLPIIVALHGLGDRPEAFARVFGTFGARARVIVPRAPKSDGYGGYRWLDSRTQNGEVDRMSREIRSAIEPIARLLADLEKEHGVRPSITGFSQGGILSFAIATAHPELVVAAVPVAGWLPPPLWPERKPARAPMIRALHGTSDSVVPFVLDQRACQRLAELGFDAELIPFEGVDHTVTPEMHRRWLDILAGPAAQH